MPTEIKTINGYKFWSNLYKKTCREKKLVDVTIELTYHCNLGCDHCYIVKNPEKKEMGFKELVSLIDQLLDEGCLGITFTGGELFLRLDCLDLLAYTSKKGFYIEIITNGTCINKKIQKTLKAIKPTMVNVSLYGISQNVYSSVTNRDKLDSCLKGIEYLQNAKIPFKINTLVTKDNIAELAMIESFSSKINADFQSDPYIHPALNQNKRPISKRVLPKDYLKTVNYVFNQEKWQKNSTIQVQSVCKTNNKYASQMKEKKYEGYNFFPCDVGLNSMTIDPYGYAYLCQCVPSPRFDTKENGLSSAWKKLVEYRASISSGKNSPCMSCKLLDYCDWCPGCSLLETGSLNKCVPYLKETAQLNKKLND